MQTHLVRLVPEEVNLLKLLVLDVPQGVGLVPPSREHVEGDLPADGEGEGQVGELLLEDLDEGGADAVDLEGGGRLATSLCAKMSIQVPCRTSQSRGAPGCWKDVS